MDQLRGNLAQKHSCGDNGNILAEKKIKSHASNRRSVPPTLNVA